jgi:trehalose synthase
MTQRKATSDLWWRNAVVYCLDVQTFLDSDGDGCGDFRGLCDRIDYLAGIGMTCLWLMPFFPSPERDDGYDIVDFYAVDPRFGTLGDLVELIRTANDRGIRVIADLVVNHTSIRHPWFQSARSSPDSPYRNFYVWRDEKPEEEPGDVAFPDQERSNWAYDEQAGQWYLHRFYSDQPDLNVANPEVRDEIAQIAGFWLQVGLSGFRVDAVPFLVEPMGLPEGAVEDPHELLRDLRAYIGRRRGDAVLLGEVNLPPPQQAEFFGSNGRRELDMIFNFHVMQLMYLALAREDARPLRAAVDRVGAPPDDCQWASFVRNHDELTLDQLSDAEREEVFAAFGPSEDVQLYGRGIRKRLPTMLGGDERRIRMVYSLAFALPGTPVLFYGEEVGMGENLDIEGRLAVRSPMQWSAGPNGGFSTTADTASLCRPLTSADGYGPDAVNVASQQRDDSSLLNWFERLIRRRKESPELGLGRSTTIEAGHPAVLALRSAWQDSTIVTVHHLGADPVTIRLQLGGAESGQRLVDLFGGEDVDPRDGRFELDLEPYAWRWWRLQRAEPAGD